MEALIRLFDSIRYNFDNEASLSHLINVYWYLIFIEIPRYYLPDIGVAIWRGLFFQDIIKKKAVAKKLLYTDRPFVTILTPGKNEGKNIYELVRSLREQTYQNFEIIVVDDGSSDDTPYICTDLERNGYIDKYLRLNERGGKASAANYGIGYTKGQYIIHLDADSSLDRNAVERILIPFYYDKKIKGVGGCVKVRNADKSLCTSMQALEYVSSIQMGRIVSNMLGIYHIISGAFGAFETETIKQVGCWDIGPGLDGDITQKLRKAGHKVYFADDAICMTNVPTGWYSLFKQRLRWSKSLVRFRIRKHRDIFYANKQFSFLNFLSNFENILYDCLFNYLWVFYILMLIFFHADNLADIFITGWIIRYACGIISFGAMMSVSERAWEEKKYFLYLPLKTFYMGYFLRIARLVAHTSEFFFFSSYRDKWNPRKASVCAQIENI